MRDEKILELLEEKFKHIKLTYKETDVNINFIKKTIKNYNLELVNNINTLTYTNGFSYSDKMLYSLTLLSLKFLGKFNKEIYTNYPYLNLEPSKKEIINKEHIIVLANDIIDLLDEELSLDSLKEVHYIFFELIPNLGVSLKDLLK